MSPGMPFFEQYSCWNNLSVTHCRGEPAVYFCQRLPQCGAEVASCWEPVVRADHTPASLVPSRLNQTVKIQVQYSGWLWYLSFF